MRTDQAAAVAAVEQKLDVEFRNKLLLLQALTHRSYLNENQGHPTGHNERLEFLGDAIIEMIVTEMLFRGYPDASEGELTNYRASLVSGQTLGPIGEALELHACMFFSKGEARGVKKDPKIRSYACCCAFEAIIGALFLDQGLGACRLILDHFIHAQKTATLESWEDPKSKLQDEAQARFSVTPHYEELSVTGPDHERWYRMACIIGNVSVSEGSGSSKQEAMKAAAKKARETISQWEGRIAGFKRQMTPATRHSGSRSSR